MENKKVSVIVPIYNTEKYLHQCIDSILGQTYSYFELILVDDGSTDHSSCICKEYVEKDNRVKYIFQRNQGAAAARNTGIDQCEGEFITFVDSDDWTDPDMLESMVKKIGDSDILQVGNHVYTSAGDVLREDQINNKVCGDNEGQEICKAVLEGKYPAGGVPWGKLYRKKLWENIKFPHIKRFEDVAILYRIFWNADSVKVVPDVKYCYRSERPGSLMHSKFDLQWLEVLDIEKEMVDFYKSKGRKDLYLLARLEYCDQLIRNIGLIKKNIPNEKQEIIKLKKHLFEEISKTFLIRGYVKKKIRIIWKTMELVLC